MSRVWDNKTHSPDLLFGEVDMSTYSAGRGAIMLVDRNDLKV